MYRAYHRWMDDYSGAFPARITGIILVSACDLARLDEHAQSIAAALPPLQHKPSDDVMSERYFNRGTRLERTRGKLLLLVLGREVW